MPPRTKSRRLENHPIPTADVPRIRFVPDPVEVTAQQAASSSSTDNNNLDPAMMASIVAAVRTTLQSQPSPATQPPDLTTESTVRQSLEEITGAPTSSGEILPSEQLFYSIAVPLGSRISSNLKTKIWAEEFIDFGSLLDTSPNPDKYSLSFTAPSNGTATTNPQFTFEPVKTPRKISSLNDWISAFHTFVAIYSLKHPLETPKLMKFCETIQDIDSRGGDWHYYDEQFRYLRQGSPNQYPWDIVHWELWHRAVNFRPKQGYQSDKPDYKFKGKFRKGSCWAYNAGRQCGPGCRYEHKCSKCGGKHPGNQCQSVKGIQPTGGNGTGSTSTSSKPSSGYSRKSFNP